MLHAEPRKPGSHCSSESAEISEHQAGHRNGDNDTRANGSAYHAIPLFVLGRTRGRSGVIHLDGTRAPAGSHGSHPRLTGHGETRRLRPGFQEQCDVGPGDTGLGPCTAGRVRRLFPRSRDETRGALCPALLRHGRASADSARRYQPFRTPAPGGCSSRVGAAASSGSASARKRFCRRNRKRTSTVHHVARIRVTLNTRIRCSGCRAGGTTEQARDGGTRRGALRSARPGGVVCRAQEIRCVILGWRGGSDPGRSGGATVAATFPVEGWCR